LSLPWELHISLTEPWLQQAILISSSSLIHFFILPFAITYQTALTLHCN